MARHKKTSQHMRVLKAGAVAVPVSAGLVLTLTPGAHAAPGQRGEAAAPQPSVPTPAQVKKLSPGDCTAIKRLTPKERQEIARLTPKERQDLARLTPKQRQELTLIAPLIKLLQPLLKLG